MYSILFAVFAVVCTAVSSQVLPAPPTSFGACTGRGTKGDINDCRIYYKCGSGVWEQQQCLSGFHFNKISQACDFQNHAGCIVGDPEQGAEPPTFGSCSGYGKKGDISDCRLYYECYDGLWRRKQCLTGFHWNAIGQRCEFISGAGCILGNPAQAAVPPMSFGACTGYGTKGDISDCRIYYKCRNSVWTREQCLSGFHFNKISQACDFQNTAGCTVGDPEQAIEPPTFGPCTGSGSTGDMKDCRIYYDCRNGQWTRRQCLSGFHWNTIGRRCDFISSAGCNKTV